MLAAWLILLGLSAGAMAIAACLAFQWFPGETMATILFLIAAACLSVFLLAMLSLQPPPHFPLRDQNWLVDDP